MPLGPGQTARLIVWKVPVLEEIKCTEVALQGKGAWGDKGNVTFAPACRVGFPSPRARG